MNIIPFEVEQIKSIIGDLLNEFDTIVKGTADQLLKLSHAIQGAERKLRGIESLEGTTPIPISTKITLKEDQTMEELLEPSESFDKVRLEVPKLINQLKILMGSELRDNLAEMTPPQKQKALKDMEEAIRILTTEYKKASGSNPSK